jgi:integrating conjugative element protein (TIGR03765 family)
MGRWWFVMACIGVLISTFSVANAIQNKLIVLKDFGNTMPLAKLNSPVKSGSINQALNNITSTFKVSTPIMHVGKVQSHAIKKVAGFTQPIFVLGCDKISAKWVSFYQARLKKLHAIGYVVNCGSKQEFLKLKGISNLPLMTIQGDAIKERFHLANYPFLLTREYISQ